LFSFPPIRATKLRASCSHAAASTTDRHSTVGPEASGPTVTAVARRPRPPTSPGTLRPATAAPEASALRCPHDHLRPAQRAVLAPADMRARVLRQARPSLPGGLRQGLSQFGIACLPSADRRDVQASHDRGQTQRPPSPTLPDECLNGVSTLLRSSLGPRRWATQPECFQRKREVERIRCNHDFSSLTFDFH